MAADDAPRKTGILAMEQLEEGVRVWALGHDDVRFNSKKIRIQIDKENALPPAMRGTDANAKIVGRPGNVKLKLLSKFFSLSATRLETLQASVQKMFEGGAGTEAYRSLLFKIDREIYDGNVMSLLKRLEGEHPTDTLRSGRDRTNVAHPLPSQLNQLVDGAKEDDSSQQPGGSGGTDNCRKRGRSNSSSNGNESGDSSNSSTPSDSDDDNAPLGPAAKKRRAARDARRKQLKGSRRLPPDNSMDPTPPAANGPPPLEEVVVECNSATGQRPQVQGLEDLASEQDHGYRVSNMVDEIERLHEDLDSNDDEGANEMPSPIKPPTKRFVRSGTTKSRLDELMGNTPADYRSVLHYVTTEFDALHKRLDRSERALYKMAKRMEEQSSTYLKMKKAVDRVAKHAGKEGHIDDLRKILNVPLRSIQAIEAVMASPDLRQKAATLLRLTQSGRSKKEERGWAGSLFREMVAPELLMVSRWNEPTPKGKKPVDHEEGYCLAVVGVETKRLPAEFCRLLYEHVEGLAASTKDMVRKKKALRDHLWDQRKALAKREVEKRREEALDPENVNWKIPFSLVAIEQLKLKEHMLPFRGYDNQAYNEIFELKVFPEVVRKATKKLKRPFDESSLACREAFLSPITCDGAGPVSHNE